MEALARETAALDGPPPVGAAPRAARCLHLLDAGRFPDAFALYGIALDAEVLKALCAKPLDFEFAAHASIWAAALRRFLWESAPWLLGDLLERERQIPGRLACSPPRPAREDA